MTFTTEGADALILEPLSPGKEWKHVLIEVHAATSWKAAPSLWKGVEARRMDDSPHMEDMTIMEEENEGEAEGENE
jgi:hypothetical protein